jgi:hypothetical protein
MVPRQPFWPGPAAQIEDPPPARLLFGDTPLEWLWLPLRL